MRGSIVKDKRSADPKNPRYFVIIEDRATGGQRKRRWHPDPATGSAFASKKKAEAFLAALLNDVNRGSYSPPSKATVDAWLDVWLGIMRPNLKPSTYASYERATARRTGVGRPRPGVCGTNRRAPVPGRSHPGLQGTRRSSDSRRSSSWRRSCGAPQRSNRPSEERKW